MPQALLHEKRTAKTPRSRVVQRLAQHFGAMVAAFATVLLLGATLSRPAPLHAFQTSYIANLGSTYREQLSNQAGLAGALQDGSTIVLLGSSELTSSDLRFIPYNFLAREFGRPVFAYGHAYFQSLGMYFLLAANEQHLSGKSRIVIMVSPGWFSERHINRQAFKEHVLPLLPSLVHNPEARDELAAVMQTRANLDLYRATVSELGFQLRGRIEDRLKPQPAPTSPTPSTTTPSVSVSGTNWNELRNTAITVEHGFMSTNPYGVRQDYLDQYLKELTPARLPAFGSSVDGGVEFAHLEKLMALLHRRETHALFVLQPYNPLVFHDLDRFRPMQDRFKAMCSTYSMDCMDMYGEQPYQPGTLRDSQHLGEVGWLDVNRRIVETFTQ